MQSRVTCKPRRRRLAKNTVVVTEAVLAEVVVVVATLAKWTQGVNWPSKTQFATSEAGPDLSSNDSSLTLPSALKGSGVR